MIAAKGVAKLYREGRITEAWTLQHEAEKIRRRKPVPSKESRKVKKARKVSEDARVYGSKARVTFVGSLPCVALHWSCTSKVEGHHIVTGGMGRKADAALTVPLCSFHHHRLHAMGRLSFERSYGVALAELAESTERAWLSSCAERGA